MSKIPALSRSFHKVSLKTLRRSGFLGSCVEAAKSGTARRTFSMPRPVPVRIQSCAPAEIADDNKSASANTKLAQRVGLKLFVCMILISGQKLSLVVEPEFY